MFMEFYICLVLKIAKMFLIKSVFRFSGIVSLCYKLTFIHCEFLWIKNKYPHHVHKMVKLDKNYQNKIKYIEKPRLVMRQT